ncbi:MAG: AAA family ATPase [Caryophanon sp.]|nr:AAA family ATPase [Caryophanon sp.]
MSRIIAFVNQKGGVAKTTSTINIGAGLALEGKKVLLVDLDAQGHLTVSLGVPAHDFDNTIYEIFKGDIAAKDAVTNIDSRYDIIPSDIRLSGLEMEMSATAGREFILKEMLEPIKDDYDYILLDCPPALGLLTLNALTAATEIFIPIQAEYLALHGMKQLLQVVDLVQKRLNPELQLTGVITTFFDKRKILNQELQNKIVDTFIEKSFSTLIRNNVALAEAQAYNLDIFAYKPSSNGAKDYAALVQEILQQEEI